MESNLIWNKAKSLCRGGFMKKDKTCLGVFLKPYVQACGHQCIYKCSTPCCFCSWPLSLFHSSPCSQHLASFDIGEDNDPCDSNQNIEAAIETLRNMDQDNAILPLRCYLTYKEEEMQILSDKELVRIKLYTACPSKAQRMLWLAPTKSILHKDCLIISTCHKFKTITRQKRGFIMFIWSKSFVVTHSVVNFKINFTPFLVGLCVTVHL